jgi:hypothetical protein
MYLGESSIPQWKLCTFLRCMTLTSTSRSWVGPRPNLPLPPSVQPSHCGVAPSPFQSERSTGTRPDHLPEANHLFVNLPRSHADQPSITAFFSWPAHSNSETATFSPTGIRPSANVFSRRRIPNESARLLLSFFTSAETAHNLPADRYPPPHLESNPPTPEPVNKHSACVLRLLSVEYLTCCPRPLAS